MANNRMFLVYRPTGDCVFLGKRMAEGWYATPEDVATRLIALFEKAEAAAFMSGSFSLDDFALAMERAPVTGLVIEDWQYEPDGSGKITKLKMGKAT